MWSRSGENTNKRAVKDGIKQLRKRKRTLAEISADIEKVNSMNLSAKDRTEIMDRLFEEKRRNV